MTDPRFLGAHSFQTAVRFEREALADDIDALGHVNNAVYVRWVQDAAVAHWQAAAPPAMQNQFIWVCLRHEIDYREQVLEGETVEVRTWLGAHSGPRFDRHTDIRVSGSNRWSVTARTTWVLLDAEKRRPRRVGPEVFDAFGLDPGVLQ